MLFWANAYAAQNRVDTRNLDMRNQCFHAGKDIPLSTYLPDCMDEEMHHERIVAVVIQHNSAAQFML